MKKQHVIYSFCLALAGILFSCSPATPPLPPPAVELDYPELKPVKGKIVIVANFKEEPCNPVVLVGSYNAWKTDDLKNLLKFQPVGKVGNKEWKGWYKVEVDTVGAAATKEIEENGTKITKKYALAAKPVQLKKDGSFDWAHQVGYNTDELKGVTKKAGEVDIYKGYPGECDIFFASDAEAAVLIFDKWKNNPCVETPKHTYTFTLKVPASTPADAVVRIVGGFKAPLPSWDPAADATVMKKQADGSYKITLENVEEGTEYKYVINGSWDNVELAAKEAGATCAKNIPNRKTANKAAIADTVENWKGIDGLDSCPDN